jgi:hypothetical protein
MIIERARLHRMSVPSAHSKKYEETMNNFSSPKNLLFILVALAMFLGLAGCTALVGLGLMDPPGLPTQDQTTPTEASAGLIAGRVWLDQCLQPEDCQLAADGSVQPNGIEDPGEAGLSGLTLELGLGSCPSTGFAESQSGANGTFIFDNVPAGTYCVSIDPGRDPNGELLGSAPWTHPAYGQGVSRITVTLREGGETRLVNFGRSAAPALDTATPTLPADVPTATPAPAGCLDWASFVTDVTIADGSRIAASKSFDKTWRLRNSGTCTWTTEYDLVFVSGNRLDGPSAKNLPRRVAPGESIDLTIRLKAPADTGLYQGYWMLRNQDNQLFGLGNKANQPFWVQIIVGPLGTTSSGSWRGEYFARRDLKGTAGFVRNDPVIDFDWDNRSPGSPLGADNFSIRWTGQSQFDSGTYRFSVRVDDGVRLYIDDKLVIDSWKDGSLRDLKAEVALARGSHKIRLEYYERAGDARVRLTWTKVDDPSFSEWRGQYWSNREFKGSPALTRNDKEINFDWGAGSPAVGIPSNDFSARWTREVNFNQGTYRFNLRADDGVRFWIGDDRVIDEWHANSGSQTYQVEATLSGKERLKVEYYERSGDARVRLWWERVEATATATATEEVTPTETEQTPATDTPEATATETGEPTATATTEPTATETEVPPTNTPTATATVPASPQVILNFASSACSATWRNEGGELPCPGSPGDSDGAVYTLSNPGTEAGQINGTGLVTEPEQTAVGFINGQYPAIAIESGDLLTAQIGCLAERPSCNVGFEVLLKIGDQTVSLGSWDQTSDGTLRTIELDLSGYAGQTVSPVLSVWANASSAQNGAVWLNPKILR